ncbi:MAG: DNA polymerase IV, partial [Polyangiaceae bacterium]|nr:DNA polymerase IV [Polyangiaceae bacterium]
LKQADFKLVTRHKTLLAPACDTQTLYRTACELLDRVAGFDDKAYRLAGVAAKDLVRVGDGQGDLFADAEAARRTRLEQALLGVRTRFGNESVTVAALHSPLAPRGGSGG